MEPFLGQIIMFGGNFAPRSWAFCDGQLLPINQNSALFSILGTIYGGDGRTTFALPDMRGRVPIHPGNGPGLSSYRLGQRGGQESVTLTISEIPSHTHTGHIKDGLGKGTTGTYFSSNNLTLKPNIGTSQLEGVTINHTGGNQAHENRQPFACVNFIIALQGTFPSRS